MSNDLMTSAEVARLLRIHPVTLSIWRSDDRGPAFIRMGNRVRYRPEEVEAYLNDRRSDAPNHNNFMRA